MTRSVGSADKRLAREGESYIPNITKGRFDNRFRHGKSHFEFSGPLGLPPGASGARFERVAIDPEIGPELVVLLLDFTPFAHQLNALEPFELHLKCGGVRTGAGPVLFLLWWIPPVTDGKPFAMYENILDAAHASTREWLRRASLQTHLHVILIGPGGELVGLYEFENTFELDQLALVRESGRVGYQDIDFAAAEREFKQTYNLTQLFLLENTKPPGVEEKGQA